MMRRSLAACLVTAALGCGGQAAAPRSPSAPTTATALIDEACGYSPELCRP